MICYYTGLGKIKEDYTKLTGPNCEILTGVDYVLISAIFWRKVMRQKKGD